MCPFHTVGRLRLLGAWAIDPAVGAEDLRGRALQARGPSLLLSDTSGLSPGEGEPLSFPQCPVELPVAS